MEKEIRTVGELMDILRKYEPQLEIAINDPDGNGYPLVTVELTNEDCPVVSDIEDTQMLLLEWGYR